MENCNCNNHDHHACGGEGETCTMCRFHRTMCGKDKCGACGGMNHHGFLRIILGIGIIVFVFWLGVKLGELSSEVSHYNDGAYGYGPSMMHSRGNYGGGYGMMGQGDVYYNDQGYATPAASPAPVQIQQGRATVPATPTNVRTQ